MQLEDMILVSVDDHLVEPPSMSDYFVEHFPAKYRDRVPRVIHRENGTDAWLVEGHEVSSFGLNAVAGRVREEWGNDPGCFEEVRALKLLCRDLYGCFPDVDERRQLLRISIEQPKRLDLVRLARGVDGTHALTRTLDLEALLSFDGNQATVAPTGEMFTLDGSGASMTGTSWQKVRVTGWESTDRLRLVATPAAPPGSR